MLMVMKTKKTEKGGITMRKGLERVATSPRASTSGNYHSEIVGSVRKLFLYRTCIGAFDTETATAFADCRGWGTITTKIAVTGLQYWLADRYDVVPFDEFAKAHPDIHFEE